MTRTSKALRRLGVSGLAAATVLSFAPLLGATAASAAGTPLLVADDCTQQSTASTTTTQGNTNPNQPVAPQNPSTATGAGSGCTTQAQVNTTKTQTFTYTEGGAPVAGRNVDFTITQPAQPTSATNPTGQPSGRFTATQPSGTTSFAGPAPTNFPGQGAQCTTDAAGKCSVSVTDSEAETITVNARESATGATAFENVQFRDNSVAVARFDEQGRVLVKPSGDPVTSPTPGRPVQLTYTAYDSNGNCTTAAAATCTGAIVRSQSVTVNVNQAAYFTPNCTPRDASATNSPQRGTAGTPAVGVTPAQPSTGTLATPDYRACSFTGTPTDDAQTTPLTSLGQSVTVVTDQSGQFTVTVVEGRDTEFDNNGISVVSVSLAVGSNTFTARTASSGLTTDSTGTASNCPTTDSTTGAPTAGTGNTTGCNVQPLVFSTRDTALNGASIALVRVDGGTPFAAGANQTPDRFTNAPIFVVNLKDQYGNLTLADASGSTPNNLATLAKSGAGELERCGGIGSNTPTSPCGGANTTSSSPVTNNDGTINRTYKVRGSFTDLAEQERFRSRTVNDINGNPIDGTQTLTAKWVAPITEYSIGTTTNGFAAGGAGNTFKSPGFDQSETDNVFTAVVTLQFYKQQAASIVFTAQPGTTVPVGTVVTLTATVTDQLGQPLSFYDVSFFRGGTSNDCNNTATNGTGGNPNGSTSTDRQGRAFFSFTCSTASTQNITLVVFDDNGAEIGRKTQTIIFTGSAVQPTSSATPTSTATPPPGGRSNLTLTVNTPLIPAGANGTLTATGSANQQYELRCYTRPSTTYFTARSGSFDAAGNPVTFTLSLGRNTRCFIQYATTPASGASPSVVINVRTVLSLSTVRTAVRTYIFQGRNLPRVAGQLITLYRVDSAGNEIRTSNLVTDNSGIYRVTRKFTGSGTFQFKVRTSQTLNNAAGVSNTINVRVF